MMEYAKCPACRLTDCFANVEKHCTILRKKDFGTRKCPFFKTKEQAAEAREYFRKIMEDNGIEEK